MTLHRLSQGAVLRRRGGLSSVRTAMRGPFRGILGCLLSVVMSLPNRALAAGTVTEADTADLLQALLGGGLVQLTFTDTLTLETPILIASDTVLEGAAAGGRTVVLSGGGQFRLFQVLPGVRFEIRNCVLRDGISTNGGAILNEGILYATNTTFTACSAPGYDGADGEDGEDRFGIGGNGRSGGRGEEGIGGAIDNRGGAILVDCLFATNHASGGSGGAGGAGGTGTILNGIGGSGGDGAHGFGGAIANRGGTLSLLRTLFTGNRASGGSGGAGGGSASTTNAVQGGGHGGTAGMASGGAIYSTGPLLISQSVFATNMCTGGDSADAGAPEGNIGLNGPPGGNALGGAITFESTGAIINSTFFTNRVVGGHGGDGASGSFIVGDGGRGGDALGGAIYVAGPVAITNATFAWNGGTNGAPGAAGSGGQAQDGRPGRLAGSAIAADVQPGPTIVNSILASVDIPTIHGPVVDAGHNLFTDAGPSVLGDESLDFTDPVLGQFQVWSSGLPGLLPLAASPAIDRANPTAAPAVDQRGVARPIGFGPDAGALEASAVALYVIGGQVLNGTNAFPGVRIFIGEEETVSDEAGNFRFNPRRSDFYIVQPENQGAGFSPRLYQLALNSDVTNLVFQAVPLSLTLTRETGSGLSRLSGVGALPGKSYQLLGSESLINWDLLETATADANGRLQFQHHAGAARTWFYRLVSP